MQNTETQVLYGPLTVSRNYSKRQKYLPFTIDPPGEAHDFCKVDSALMRSKNRRSRRHKEKIYVVCYSLILQENEDFASGISKDFAEGTILALPGAVLLWYDKRKNGTFLQDGGGKFMGHYLNHSCLIEEWRISG